MKILAVFLLMLLPAWAGEFNGLGVALKEHPTLGVVVSDLVHGGGAEQAGMQRSDVIKEVNGFSVAHVADVRSALKNTQSGDTLSCFVLRANKDLLLLVPVQKLHLKKNVSAASEKGEGALFRKGMRVSEEGCAESSCDYVQVLATSAKEQTQQVVAPFSISADGVLYLEKSHALVKLYTASYEGQSMNHPLTLQVHSGMINLGDYLQKGSVSYLQLDGQLYKLAY